MAHEGLTVEYDVAQGLDQGARPYQEDCIASDFAIGAEAGFCVLADGMGAHSAGDQASAAVVRSVFSQLKSQNGLDPDALRDAADTANRAIADSIDARPETRGMGSTLLACAIVRDMLYWVSVGDSPLYLFRQGDLTRLNQDHSMAPQIDAMVATGQISASAAALHPERNVLTSALVGQNIAKVDCPGTGFALQSGDILIVASDGLQSLKDPEIQKMVRRHGQRDSASLVRSLMEGVTERSVTDQDNVSMIVIRITVAATTPEHATPSDTPALPEIEEAPDFLKAVFS